MRALRVEPCLDRLSLVFGPDPVLEPECAKTLPGRERVEDVALHTGLGEFKVDEFEPELPPGLGNRGILEDQQIQRGDEPRPVGRLAGKPV